MEAARGRISTASLNSHVQIKCQICILGLCFQARDAAARKKRMGGECCGCPAGNESPDVCLLVLLFKAIYQGGQWPRPVCPSMPHL